MQWLQWKTHKRGLNSRSDLLEGRVRNPEARLTEMMWAVQRNGRRKNEQRLGALRGTTRNTSSSTAGRWAGREREGHAGELRRRQPHFPLLMENIKPRISTNSKWRNSRRFISRHIRFKIMKVIYIKERILKIGREKQVMCERSKMRLNSCSHHQPWRSADTGMISSWCWKKGI